jgi:hypothetical protein
VSPVAGDPCHFRPADAAIGPRPSSANPSPRHTRDAELVAAESVERSVAQHLDLPLATNSDPRALLIALTAP